jgi:EAL domain-containing protein (putative c-di-GMP-specific phosphodiesterase class I)
MAPEHTNNGNDGPPSPDVIAVPERDELEVYFQPKVDLRSGRVIGVEALVRWVHPSRGVVSARDFLGDLEADEMRELTERVIELSTRAAGDWWRSCLGLQVSVNLAGCSLSDPSWDLRGFVAQALSASGLTGKALQFEVTEDILIKDPARATDVLGQLSELGAGVSLDDFGTGHFSVRQLLRLPIDEVKIDHSVIRGLLGDEENKMIARSIIHFAHQLQLQVMAEGVETQEAWHQLRSMGAERAQGFLISEPLPSREVPAFLASWSHRARELRSTKPTKRRRFTTRKRAGTPAEATA